MTENTSHSSSRPDSSSQDKISFENAASIRAYQAVAQSSAIVIQDAADYLRNMETISTTAIGSALAKALNDPDKIDAAKAIIDIAQEALSKSRRQRPFSYAISGLLPMLWP